MFPQDKIDEARIQLALEERIKKELEMYGGAANVPQAAAPESEDGDTSEGTGTATGSAMVFGRYTGMPGSRLSH